uniref:(northern house mosquito) hypothetical protein n=1 Tax=Culex pipiens TaxID=7175 RepID=A0A8D8FMR8_CULPI
MDSFSSCSSLSFSFSRRFSSVWIIDSRSSLPPRYPSSRSEFISTSPGLLPLLPTSLSPRVSVGEGHFTVSTSPRLSSSSTFSRMIGRICSVSSEWTVTRSVTNVVLSTKVDCSSK